MRTWTVEGADSATGQDRVISIEAITREEAEKAARESGLLISSVHESTVDPTDPLASLASAMRGRSTQRPPAVAAYASPSLRQVAPDYVGLKIGGSVLSAFALLYYIIGIVVLIAVCIALIGEVSHGATMMSAVMISFTGAMTALSIMMVGGLLHALSAGCSALRDLARNSFGK